LISSRRKLEVEHDDTNVDDLEISDYVKTRLLIARVRALQKYQEKWG
jgi:hypothetical protein